MVVMTMVAMMMCGGKSRAGKYEDKQNSSENLLHGPNLACGSMWEQASESRQERGARATRREHTRRKLKIR
jgi:hypothetical protein